MTRLALLGATGKLGSQVARQALQGGWELSAAVRARNRLAPEVAERARVTTIDLGAAAGEDLARFVEGHDVLVCCAGVVTEGQGFVALIDRVVSAVESLPAASRPVAWFLGGAGLLDLDARGRRGVDLPKVRDSYWPHRVNFERLTRSGLNWRMLCPGPMVDQPGLGLARLRISIDKLPTPLPAIAGSLPAALVLPLFAAKIPEMIVPYADAAALMLANADAAGPMAHRRIGIALPEGMRGRKDEWAAQPRNAS